MADNIFIFTVRETGLNIIKGYVQTESVIVSSKILFLNFVRQRGRSVVTDNSLIPSQQEVKGNYTIQETDPENILFEICDCLDNFENAYFDRFVNSFDELKAEKETGSSIFKLKDSDIYFLPTSMLNNSSYWDYIVTSVKKIFISRDDENNSKNSTINLILHIGDAYQLKNGQTTFKGHFNDVCNNDIKPSAETVSQLMAATVYGFHHNNDKRGIYRDIVINENFWKKVDWKNELSNELEKNLEDDGLQDVIISIDRSYYRLLNGDKITESDIKWNKFNPDCKKNTSSSDYAIVYATKFSFESIDFYLNIADFQLCDCDITTYRKFKKNIKDLNDNSIEKMFETNRTLVPTFKKTFTGKPIIIYGIEKFDILNKQFVDRRISYLDSSIWLQYVYKENEFDTAKKNIEKWNNLGLYGLDNAKEYLEFRTRLVKNSFLQKFKEGEAHADKVAPFIFHSESRMSKKSKTKKEDIDNINVTGLKWRFLLIDDKATLQQNSHYSKCKIIRSTLSEHFNINCKSDCCCSCKVEPKNTKKKDGSPKSYTIDIDCASTIEISKQKMQVRRYDIILLDYLLSETEEHKKTEYGYQLLKKLQEVVDNNPAEWTNKKGPLNKFWFFFITAFTHAVNERLHEQGLTYNTNHWNIARGACPITTPELFKYNLLNFMYRQFEEITQLPETSNTKFITLTDLLEFIFVNNIRINAINLFNALLKLRANYNYFKHDANPNGSLLINCLFTDVGNYDNAFWEHLQHLVYLTAFGTIRQWPDMWEEYMLIKDKLDNNIAKSIEKYIISLNK
ncbi:hypothetical protein FACS189426_16790 [Bacteroidia bacterium]|nr:hypothetical protein FACS189426_16790 [Bacteroidia bacterium]